MKKNIIARRAGRIIAFLNREELDFIDRIGKDALFTTGHKLTRTDVIRALVDAARDAQLNGKDIHTRDELEKRLLRLMESTLADTAKELNEQKREMKK